MCFIVKQIGGCCIVKSLLYLIIKRHRADKIIQFFFLYSKFDPKQKMSKKHKRGHGGAKHIILRAGLSIY